MTTVNSELLLWIFAPALLIAAAGPHLETEARQSQSGTASISGRVTIEGRAAGGGSVELKARQRTDDYVLKYASSK